MIHNLSHLIKQFISAMHMRNNETFCVDHKLTHFRFKLPNHVTKLWSDSCLRDELLVAWIINLFILDSNHLTMSHDFIIHDNFTQTCNNGQTRVCVMSCLLLIDSHLLAIPLLVFMGRI